MMKLIGAVLITVVLAGCSSMGMGDGRLSGMTGGQQQSIYELGGGQ